MGCVSLPASAGLMVEVCFIRSNNKSRDFDGEASFWNGSSGIAEVSLGLTYRMTSPQPHSKSGDALHYRTGEASRVIQCLWVSGLYSDLNLSVPAADMLHAFLVHSRL